MTSRTYGVEVQLASTVLNGEPSLVGEFSRSLARLGQAVVLFGRLQTVVSKLDSYPCEFFLDFFLKRSTTHDSLQRPPQYPKQANHSVKIG